jgi:hypothetical protein
MLSRSAATGSMAEFRSIDPARRAAFWARVVLAGPWTAALTFLVVAAAPLWVPKGAGGVNQIAFPLVLMPLIWAVLFFYALLDRSVLRIAIVFAAITAMNLYLLRGYLFG